MTNFGKALVYLNLVLSVMMAAGALALWTNRIDFTSTKGKEGQADGLLASRQAQITDLKSPIANLGTAEASWLGAHNYLIAQEATRVEDQKWYDAEMDHLRTGAKETDPARTIDFDKGLPRLDAKGRPKMVAAKDRSGNPLRSRTRYDADIDAKLKEISVVLMKYDALVKEDTELTQRMLGPKGLQQRLIDERVKRDNVLKEQDLVKPLLVNTVVDSELILKRTKALEARIKELKSVGVATGEGGAAPPREPSP